ncbi:MAG: glycerol-3-phosphate 1-O-acyltransferase PlsY [Candidatus Eremiobacteraeota bacterium]|nr:glycerol-3-phosphate 1-O-acyltransferase PlsY [Candidatus Eremiobacteraeota bacterium]
MSDYVYIVVPAWPYIVFGFLLGTIPFGLIVSRVFFRRDLRAAGSGNIGAANALRTLGRTGGLTVLLLDALKGTVAVLATANHLFVTMPPDLARLAPHAHVSVSSTAFAPLAGLAAIVGHCYSPWLRFRGGKGVATFLGAAFALSWESGLAFVLVWLACVVPTGWSSLGSMLGAVVAAAVIAFETRNDIGSRAVVFALLSVAIIVWRHRDNIERLLHGSESRLSLLRR